jgi:hypothetical protein
MLENKPKLTVLVVILSIVLAAGTAVALKSFMDNPRQPQQTRDTYYGYGAPGASTGPGGGCGGSCCRTPGQSQGQGERSNVDIARELAISYYSSTYGDTAFEVDVRDFGCHQEAYIIKDGKQVKLLSISGGNVYER